MAKGKKTGGRKKGTPNHITAERKAKLIEAQMAGLTPLDYMLGILRDEDAKPDPAASDCCIRRRAEF
jgi:hypothetical protein